MSTKIRFEKDVENAPAIEADVDHGAVNTEKEDNLNLGLVQQGSDIAEEMKLDDARRVKAVSPGLLVAKRFFRNKLAMVGLAILIILFLFCFLGSAIYPYSEKDVFTKYKDIQFDYSYARITNSYSVVPSEYRQPGSSLLNRMNSYIVEMKTADPEVTTKAVTDGGKNYIINKKTDDIYEVVYDDMTSVAVLAKRMVAGTYSANKIAFNVTLQEPNDELVAALKQEWQDNGKSVASVSLVYQGSTYTLSGGKVFRTYSSVQEQAGTRMEGVDDAVVTEALANLGGNFSLNGKDYVVEEVNLDGEQYYNVNTQMTYVPFIATTLSLDKYTITDSVSPEFRFAAFAALGEYDANDPATATFTADGRVYTIAADGERLKITYDSDDDTVDYVAPNVYSIRRYSGEDTVSITTKRAMQAVMDYMLENGLKEYDAIVNMEALDEEGNYVVDEEGNIVFDEEEFFVKTEDRGTGQQFVFRNTQTKLVADIHADPSSEHILGLDSNAMDVLARIMYGGRVSLLIGFIVVFIEIILGSIMGGISGYFGGIVDNIIMRIVDIFYCIPTMPILIILGAMFDKINLPNLERIIWMMAVLGFLGWPGIARLVRGQILSLREQDFMIAAEASGLKASRKIAKHLIPNVIPQLIVQATMGLGGIIITESTLSFLGLGVKFPMATWGQIINSVSSITDMAKYTYIWIPVGGLICLAVIAFNFVGDGLRDAFDPKMSR